MKRIEFELEKYGNYWRSGPEPSISVCDWELRRRFYLGRAKRCTIVATDEPTRGAVKMVRSYDPNRDANWKVDGDPTYLLDSFSVALTHNIGATVYAWVELPQ